MAQIPQNADFRKGSEKKTTICRDCAIYFSVSVHILGAGFEDVWKKKRKMIQFDSYCSG